MEWSTSASTGSRRESFLQVGSTGWLWSNNLLAKVRIRTQLDSVFFLVINASQKDVCPSIKDYCTFRIPNSTVEIQTNSFERLFDTNKGMLGQVPSPFQLIRIASIKISSWLVIHCTECVDVLWYIRLTKTLPLVCWWGHLATQYCCFHNSCSPDSV